MKKNTLARNSFFALAAALLLLWGCQDLDRLDGADVTFSGEYATALLYADISMADIVGELDSTTTVEIDSDGLLHLIYRGNYTERSSTDIFFSIPDIPLPLFDTIVEFPFLVPNGMILDVVRLKSADIILVGQNPHNEPVTVVVELPEVYHPDTEEVYTYTTTAAANGIVTGAMDLTGWNLVPNDGAVYVHYTATLPNGDHVLLNNMVMQFSNFEASYLEGYLGVTPYNIPRDTIDIDFFERWIGGSVLFDNPTINVTCENSFGIPVRSELVVMDVWNLDGSIVPVQSTDLEAGIDFNYPSLNDGEVGEVKYTSFVMDKSNSNVQDIFSNRPLAVDYQLNAIGNPDGDTSIKGFATDSSYFSFNVFVDLPLVLDADFFTFSTDVESENSDSYDYADYIELKVLTENRIPLDLALQIYFLDASGNRLDSLFDVPTSGLLPDYKMADAAITDAAGYSAASSYNERLIPLPADKIDAFAQATDFSLITVLDNSPDQIVQIREEDNCIIKIGVKADLHH